MTPIPKPVVGDATALARRTAGDATALPHPHQAVADVSPYATGLAAHLADDIAVSMLPGPP
ncbi:hypothetical protein [Streptomyces adelaidensis]|uniref:hypothetical protein n=1 Tax=Streptomyces adelaidensis TaxID=2796465 RepID=UPI001905EB93|nr:hypothetical protein [Streptomyces adelaidensis]